MEVLSRLPHFFRFAQISFLIVVGFVSAQVWAQEQATAKQGEISYKPTQIKPGKYPAAAYSAYTYSATQPSRGRGIYPGAGAVNSRNRSNGPGYFGGGMGFTLIKPDELLKYTIVPDNQQVDRSSPYDPAAPKAMSQSQFVMSVSALLSATEVLPFSGDKGITLAEKRAFLAELKNRGIDVTDPTFESKFSYNSRPGEKIDPEDQITISPVCSFGMSLTVPMYQGRGYSVAVAGNSVEEYRKENLATLKMVAEVYGKKVSDLQCDGKSMADRIKEQIEETRGYLASVEESGYMGADQVAAQIKSLESTLAAISGTNAPKPAAKPVVRKEDHDPNLVAANANEVSVTQGTVTVRVAYDKANCQLSDLENMVDGATRAFGRTTGRGLLAPYGRERCSGQVQMQSTAALNEATKRNLPRLAEQVVEQAASRAGK